MDLEEQLEQELSPPKLLSRFITKKAAEKGITLSEKAISRIERQCFNSKGLLKNDGLVKSLRLIPGVDSQESFDAIMADISIFLSEITDRPELLFLELVQKESQASLSILRACAGKPNREYSRQLKAFHKEIKLIWGEALDQLELLINTCLAAGLEMNKLYMESQEDDLLFNVLDHLHSRACQIANEILILLKAGYSDGAHARWRSLNELVVFGYFIKSKGAKMAERYLDHYHIVNYKQAQSFNKHSHESSMHYYPPEEMADLAVEYNRIIEKYKLEINKKGNPTFVDDYGWARFTDDNGKFVATPNFQQLEELVSLSHLRPYYRLACNNVHGGPSRMFFSLGTGPDHLGAVLHTGPSIDGLSMPLHSTAISLNQLTGNLLTYFNKPGHLVLASVINGLYKDVEKQCLSIRDENL